MKLSTLTDRLDAPHWAERSPDVDPEVWEVEIDSREVEPGTIFVALVGASEDGHDYVGDAVDAGAEAVMIERGREEEARGEADVPTLVVEDSRRALGPLSAELYGHPSRQIEVVGVTGTNGKTTVCWLLESIYRAAGREVGVIGTLGHRWGERMVEGVNTTPESVVVQKLLAEMLEDGVETVVMEVSSHGLATGRLRGTCFDCGLFTNLSQDHLDFHGDLESYRRVKESFFTDDLVRSAAIKSPVAVLNCGDETGRAIEASLGDVEGVTTLSFGVGRREVDVGAEVVGASLGGTEIEIAGIGASGSVRSPLLGAYNVENVAAAAAASVATGVSSAAIERGIEDVSTVPGRLEPVGASTPASSAGPVVFVDYAHTPDALGTVLETLRPLTPGRLIVVFGCGGDRDRDKRPRMGLAAREGADLVVVTSDNPRSEPPGAIIDEIVEGISAKPSDWSSFSDAAGGLWVEPDRGEAIKRAIGGGQPEDVVLVAGKGHEQYQERAEGRHPFDDTRCARDALERLR